MEKLKKTLIKKAASYARHLFACKKDRDLVFHDFKHTKRVVRYAHRIATETSIGKQDYILLMVAAWLHDLEYIKGSPGLKKKQTSLAEGFLLFHHVNTATVLSIMNIIHSTRIPQKPTSLVANILCDADLYYFGSKRFFKWTKALRKETQRRTGEKISKVQWFNDAAKSAESHVYFTDYARKALRKGVKRNLVKLKTRQKDVDTPVASDIRLEIQSNR